MNGSDSSGSGDSSDSIKSSDSNDTNYISYSSKSSREDSLWTDSYARCQKQCISVFWVVDIWQINGQQVHIIGCFKIMEFEHLNNQDGCSF